MKKFILIAGAIFLFLTGCELTDTNHQNRPDDIPAGFLDEINCDPGGGAFEIDGQMVLYEEYRDPRCDR